MTSDNHVTGPVSDAMIEAGLAAACTFPGTKINSEAAKAIYLAMKSKEQASVHSPDEVERVRAIIEPFMRVYSNPKEIARQVVAALQHPAKEMRE